MPLAYQNLNFPDLYLSNALKSLNFCGCHQNTFFSKDPQSFLITATDNSHSFLLMVLLSVINRCYIKYKCFIKSADDKSTICAKPPVILCWNVKIFNWGAIKIISH